MKLFMPNFAISPASIDENLGALRVFKQYLNLGNQLGDYLICNHSS